jgi:diaminopimelate epimerase
MNIPFLKMHGAGNDFVVIDRREGASFAPQFAAQIADRRFGVGCDQVVVLEPSSNADCFMRLFNADASEARACGNATRCVASLLMEEKSRTEVTIETLAGVLSASLADKGITVNMGEPKWEWRDIPLSESRNTLHLGLQEGALMDPVAVAIGNPHMIFFVRDVTQVDLAKAGAVLEHHPLFPERVNVSVVQVIDETHLKMRTFERGAGLTLACGSAACASVVAAVRRGLAGRSVQVDVPGGTLFIEWVVSTENNGHVLMTGPAARVFSGEIPLADAS